MNQDFWLLRWQHRQIGFHQTKFTTYLKHYKLTPPDSVLVPLCGKTLDLLYLAQNCSKVVGVEIVPTAVQEFFADNNLNPEINQSHNFCSYKHKNIELIVGDFFEYEPLADEFTLVFDRAALIALPPALRIKYAHKIKSLNIKTIALISLDYPQAEKSGPPFAVSVAEITQLYGDKYEIKLLERSDLSEEKFSHLTYINESAYLLTAKN